MKQTQRGKKLDNDMKEMLSMMKTFNSYMYGPEKDIPIC